MTNLAKPRGTSWGEDPHFELAKARDAGLAVDPDLLQRVEAEYVLRIRDRLQRNQEARDVAAAAEPASSAIERLTELFREMVREGTEDIFAKALSYVLDELDELRKLEPSAYIVDQRTGRLVAPLSEETIMRPEGAATPIVNPAITTALALGAAEQRQMERVRELASDPVKGLAYQHLTDPQRIAKLAKEKLEKAGVSISDAPSGDVVWLEFGRESVEADLQSTNTSFHRLAMYSSIVAIHVHKACGDGGVCWIGGVEKRGNGRERWYAVPVATRTSLQLS